jgi:hypothetical protein
MFDYLGAHHDVEGVLSEGFRQVVSGGQNLKPALRMGLSCLSNALLTEIDADNFAPQIDELTGCRAIPTSYI